MRTKLVYVLTCSVEKYYIEQALMAVYSARYYNPTACIVLLMDNETNDLLIGTRSLLLDYISEKKVIRLSDEMSMIERSRWLKTSVRNIIDGDFLFVDTDTIVTQQLNEIDTLTCDIGAVLDSHLTVAEFPDYMIQDVSFRAKICSWNLKDVDHYYSSGVLFVRDNESTRKFYEKWHSYWLDSCQKKLFIDQPAMTKANLEMNLICQIEGVWNCIMYMKPLFVKFAKILHFTALNNESFLFSERVLNKLRTDGLNDYLISNILSPTQSFFPYLREDFVFFKFFKTLKLVSKNIRMYGENIDPLYEDLNIKSRLGGYIKSFYQHRIYYFPTFLWMLWFILKKKYKK